jgi:hypothetical protein
MPRPRIHFLLAAALVLAGPLLAQRQVNVAQLETFLKSSVQLRHPDNQIADTIKTFKLMQRLDARKVEDLQGLGVGPRTLAALKELSAASVGMPMPGPATPVAPAAVIPPPSPEEIRKILAEVRKNALDYTKTLPNFICTQITRRRYDPSGTGSWRLADTIQEQLSFVDQKEDYKVTLVNNLPVTNVSHQQLGGVTSSGEFGTMLYQIFKPETETDFEWARWATLRGRRTYVFSFRVLQAKSEYSIYDQESGRTMIGGYHGLIYADRDSKSVMRILMEVDGLQNFPVNAISLDLNYDFADIAEQKFVLPLKAELRSRSGRMESLNEVEFRMYRKFATEASIVFDVPDEIPPEDLQEKPPVPDQKR